MKPFSLFRFAGNPLRGRKDKKKSTTRRPAGQLILEELENRTLLSVVPAPTAGNSQNITPGAFKTSASPQVAMDPLKSNVLIEFDTTGPANLNFILPQPPANNNMPNAGLEGNFSTDGGKTWFAISGLGGNLIDPLSNPSAPQPYTTVGAPSVTFDSLHNAYVIFTEFSPGDNAGVVVLNKYDFSGPVPTVVFENHVLYQWAGLDPAYNPVIAIDTNQAHFVDPSNSNLTQTDNLARTVTKVINGQTVTVPAAIYAAFNIQQAQPTSPLPSSLVPLDRILVVGSDDGGLTFSTQEYVNAPNGAATASSVLQFVTAASVTPGGAAGLQTGRFFNDALEAGHDLVAVTSTGITTVEVNAFGQIVNFATTALPANTVPLGFTAGKFNGDAFTDLAVVYQSTTDGSTFVQTYFGVGDGTVNPANSLTLAGTATGAIVAGNFVSGNANLDLAVGEVNNGGKVQVFLGQSNGTFTANGTVLTSVNDAAAVPIKLLTGHFNSINDAFVDLVVANDGSNDVAVLTGNGNGTFNAPTAGGSLAGIGVPRDIAVADFNNDGRDDVAALTNTTGTNAVAYVALGAGTGSFVSNVASTLNQVPVTTNAIGIVASDFNGDGNTDVASIDFTMGSGSTLSAAAGNGFGSFLPLSSIDPSPEPAPIALVTGDFNNDGLPDVAEFNGDATNNVLIFTGFKQRSTASAQGSSPRIVFTQGTSVVGNATPRVPGGELVFVWNGSELGVINNTLTEVFDRVDMNVSQPSGGNALAPALPVDSVLYAGGGGAIQDATGTGPGKVAGVSLFPVNVNLSANQQFATLKDLAVSLNLIYPNVGQLQIDLLVPASVTAMTGITSIRLLNPGFTLSGQTTKQGLPGVANLGYVLQGQNPVATGATSFDAASGGSVFAIGGTVFQLNGNRAITDPKNAQGKYVGVFQPDGAGTLQTLLNAGLPASVLNGTWTLKITSVNGSVPNPPPEFLGNWALNLTSGISTNGFGASKTLLRTNAPPAAPGSTQPLLGSANGNFRATTPSTFTDVGPNGIGPAISIAVDNTLGAFSPYQGRIYIAYTGYQLGFNAPPTNVFIISSDNSGGTFTNPKAFTDDSFNTNFSQGNRPKYGAVIQVDPVTGTLVVEYYDGRYDPANLRVANAVQTSIDGGQSFSTASFLNVMNTATDFLTDNVETIEPIPGNPNLSLTGFGDRASSIVVYDGHIAAVFSSNLNSGNFQYGSTISSDLEYTTAGSIFSNTATFAAGPRVVQGDQGPVTRGSNVDGTRYNVTYAADGTRQLTSFVVTFDRPVDVNSFSDGMGGFNVQMFYHSPTAAAGSPGAPVAIGSVVGLDVGSTANMPGLSAGNPLATTFLITLAVPASAVGTYSYLILPAVHDDVRSKQNNTTVLGNDMDQDANGTADEATDGFAVPKPQNGIPFQLPYVNGSEPLIIPGPHVVYTYAGAGNAPTAAQVTQFENNLGDTAVTPIAQTDNVVLNQGASSMYIVFDRDMNTASLTKSAILSILGPNGPITGNFTITADPVGTDPALAKRTFLVTFPTQTLSGTYTITFAPTATDLAHSAAVDTNLNAGLYGLQGSDPTNKTSTVSSYTNSTPVAIKAKQTVTSTITVPDSFVITQDTLSHIQVQLNINYANDPDLSVSLVSPGGIVIPLFANVGHFGGPPFSNFQNTIFDDFASTPIQQASVPFDIGPFNPQLPLSRLIGTSSFGTWKLQITDSANTLPGGPAQLTTWSLKLPRVVPGTGLGETVADQFTTSFRIFTQSPTNPVSSTSFTAVGPASENDMITGIHNAISGQVNAIAVDPSDPSGNTVYVGGATGGIWKTTNFLTKDPNGPTWVPLATTGPTNSLNISSIAVFGVNNDPNQSVIFAITGDSSQYGQAGYPSNPASVLGAAGVGLLRSTDGGKTWQVLSGMNNVDSSLKILPITSPQRDNTFLGQVGFKVAVDPTRLPGGGIAVYAAFSNGLYRSTNGGNTWQLVMAGDCTDVTLAAASGDANGNLQTLYAAFQKTTGAASSGVFMTTNAVGTVGLSLMAGGAGVNNRVQNGLTGGLDTPIPVASGGTPNGKGGRIVLATPSLSGSPLQNVFYQGWLYAAVIGTNGGLAGLYMTKDFGSNWTLIPLPVYVPPGTNINLPSNNTSLPSYDPTAVPGVTSPARFGDFDIALNIDPQNPNVVYLGGVDGNNQPAGGMLRVDTSKVLDAYAEVGYLNNSPTANPQFGNSSKNGAANAAAGSVNVTFPDLIFGYGITDPVTRDLVTLNNTPNYLNLYRNPTDPFVQPSTLQFQNITQFNNNGFNVQWGPFAYFLPEGGDLHTLLTMVDPVTGDTRVIAGTGVGVFTGVDDGTGSAELGATFNTTVSGTRNGNLQLAQMINGSSQPSTLAASISGALYLAGTRTGGAASSSNTVLTLGNITWTGTANTVHGFSADQTGTGATEQFDLPESVLFPFLPTDFFQVTVAPGSGAPTSRTSGLLQAGDSPAQNMGQWPLAVGFNFAINPVDPTTTIISSQVGNIFRTSGPTTGFGVRWFQIGSGTGNFDGTNAQALTFGAPLAQNNLDNFIYAGTRGGHLYVTLDGGGTWTDISAGLDGSSVEQIVTDPRRGSHDAYAVTQQGVYFMADSTATGATWVKINDTAGKGTLFGLTRGNFGSATDLMPTLQQLTTIAADWRYAIPDNPSNPTGPTHPVLYVGGQGGVFRSLDQGKTWTYYPDMTADGAVSQGGNLPNALVTGLTLVLGNINPATGFPDTSSGLNQLIVSTYGSGDYAIRLNPNAKVNGKPVSAYLNQPKGGPAVSNVTEIVPIPGTRLTGFEVTFSGPVDPTTFTPQVISQLSGPAGAIMVARVVDVTPAPMPGQASLHNVYDIIFATPQTATGNYSITFGPGITDDSGDAMAAAVSRTLFFTPDTVPVISPNPLADRVVAPGASSVVTFAVSSAQYTASQLTVSAASSNTGLLPNANLVLTHTGANYTLTINAPAGTNTGQSMVTITVTDPQTLATVSTFNVIVDVAPVLPAINGNDTITLPHNQFPFTGSLGASSPVGNTLTYTANAFADSLLFDLQSQFNFKAVGAFTVAGTTAYVVQAQVATPASGGFYLIRPSDGGLFAYDGSGSYSHTFQNVAATATLGANVFLDPGLLLNAQPPADYATLNNLQNQFHFQQAGVGYYVAGALAYVLQASSNNSFGNKFYLVRPSDGALFAYDGSGSYAHTFANVTPIATLGPNIYAHPQELLNAIAAPPLYAQLNQLQSQYDLQFNGSFMTNLYGHGAQWIYSPILNQFGQHWYTLILNPGGASATLRAWEGYADSATGAVIATLDPSVYSNPALLTTATFMPNPAVTASVDGSGNLTIGLPNGNYIGTFKVTVTASDGLLSASQTVTVNSTDTAPTVTVKQGATTIPPGTPQNVNHGSFPQTYTVTTSDAESDAVTTTVSASSFNSLFSLQQRYQFKQAGVGYYVAGELAFVMTADQTNQFGNTFYLIRSDGGVYAYDGSGSYTHTFQNVTPIGNVGVQAYFDPTLLFTAQPPVNYTQLFTLENQFHFQGVGSFPSNDAIAYKLQATSNNAFGNPFYVLTPDGNIYPLDATGTAAHTIANVAPIATVDPGVFVNPGLLINAITAPTQYDQLLAVNQQFDLQFKGSFMTGMLGNAAKWLYSPLPNSHGQNWYTLVLAPNGTQALLYAYDGGPSSIPAGAQQVATLDASVYFNPFLLLTAKAPEAATNVTAGLSGGTLTVNAPATFVGTFQVTVTSTDGIKATTQTYTFNSKDTPPVPNTVPPQTASASGSPLHVTLSSTDAQNDTPTYTASAQTYNPAFNLQQVYNFTGVGQFTTNGTTAYVLSSAVQGGVKGFYLLKSDGGVYAYDGGKDYATTFANPANLIATLSPNVFTNPSLLTNAVAPTALNGVVSVSGNTLTVNVAGLTPGTVFQVVLAAFDGAEATRTSFLVTVTA